jgi:hypothetical protein
MASNMLIGISIRLAIGVLAERTRNLALQLPDQTLDHRPGCQWWRQSSEPRTPLGKTPDIRKNLRQFGSHPGNPGSKLSCA